MTVLGYVLWSLKSVLADECGYHTRIHVGHGQSASPTDQGQRLKHIDRELAGWFTLSTPVAVAILRVYLRGLSSTGYTGWRRAVEDNQRPGSSNASPLMDSRTDDRARQLRRAKFRRQLIMYSEHNCPRICDFVLNNYYLETVQPPLLGQELVLSIDGPQRSVRSTEDNANITVFVDVSFVGRKIATYILTTMESRRRTLFSRAYRYE